jgi:phosphoserine phosphatase
VSEARKPGVLFDVDRTLLESLTIERIHRAIGIASKGLVEHLLGRPDAKAVEAQTQEYDALRDQVVFAELAEAGATKIYSEPADLLESFDSSLLGQIGR